MLRLLPRLAAAAVALGAQVAIAQTVELGRETVSGRCVAVQTTGTQAQASSLQYFDGTVRATATINPTQSLPAGKPDDAMSACATSAYDELARNSNYRSAPEETFLRFFNMCLADKRASYLATAVVLRRGPVECAPTAADAMWLNPLRVELARCATKDNQISRAACSSKAIYRFCDSASRRDRFGECKE